MKLVVVLILSALLASSGMMYSNAQENVRVETVASNLEIPWSIAFTPDGRIFLTERVGNVRVIENGKLLEEPAARINVARTGETGLLGIALDPDFANNRYVYLYYTYSELFSVYNRVSRFTEADNRLFDERILLDRIPGAAIHDGGRIKFGPDGKLYVTTGDAAIPSLSQDLNSLAGKILRINSDGSVPDDNPFPNSPVYAYGLRNPQGLDWDPRTGKLVVTVHGPAARDEVNVIEPEKNYGWPHVAGKAGHPEYEDPIVDTGDITWAPSGASFYTSNKIPEWEGKYFIATLRGNHLRVLDLDIEANEVISSEALFLSQFGRLRDAVQGPDGYLYILTSNRDGRGSPAPDDDRVLRILPVFETHTFFIEAEGMRFPVVLRTDATISSLQLNQEMKQISVRAESTANVFANVTLAKELLGGPYTLTVDQEQELFTMSENVTHASIYFQLPSGSSEAVITGTTVIPEFAYWQLSFLLATLAVILLGMRSGLFSKIRINIR